MNCTKPNFRRFSLTRSASLSSLVCALLLTSAGLTATAQSSSSSLGTPTGFVNDYANVIDSPTRAKLETVLTNLKQRADIEIAVVTVPTTNGEDIFDYSLALARRWGIGSKGGDKAGLLFLAAINDRKYFTQVSDHLEGDLPDGLVGQIQRERLVPQFKRGNYSQGIYDTIQAYIATLAQKRGFNIDGIDKRYAYGGNTDERPSTGSSKNSASCFTVVVIIFIIIIVLSSIKRGGRGGGGCLNMFLLGSLFNSIGSSRGSSGWGGGGFGGGGGGGFGGFGGGGSFGGGGAGGSW